MNCNFTELEFNIIKKIVEQAGKIILKNLNIKKWELKKDFTPVTEVDILANKFIEKKLRFFFPKIKIISEEENVVSINTNTFFLVDPLDGTKEFIKGGNNFTVNIALIENCQAKYGFIFAPMARELYWNDNENAYLRKNYQEKKLTASFNGTLNIELSQTHLDAKTNFFLDKLNSVGQKNFISSSLKLCNLAKGISSFYPRLSKTMEWDIAAGHSILKNAGGNIFDLEGKTLMYNKYKYMNNGFLAFAGKKLPDEIIQLLKHENY